MSLRAPATDLLVLRRRHDGRTEWLMLDAPDASAHPGLLVRPLAGRGLGVLSTRRFECGERLVAEAPLLVWESCGAPDWSALEALVDGMTAASRRAFFALADKHDDVAKSAQGIWNTNSHLAEDIIGDGAAASGVSRTAVYQLCSRFNHACAPSAHAAWNAALGMSTVHALRDIAAGEEVTLAYISGAEAGTRAERRALLRGKYRFECVCAKCGLEGASLARSDERMARLAHLHAALAAHAVDGELVPLVEEQLALMRAEGVPLVWGRAGILLAIVALARGGAPAAASKLALAGAAAARTALGVDSSAHRKFESLAAHFAAAAAEGGDGGGAAAADGGAGEAAAPFRVRDAGRGRGLGVFATRDISAGERLLSEPPLAVWPRALSADAARATDADATAAAFSATAGALSPATRAAILELSQAGMFGEELSLLGVWLSNALPVTVPSEGGGGDGGGGGGGGGEGGGKGGGGWVEGTAVFRTVCRFNHACAPNCHEEWNQRTGRMTVHAVAAVAAGDELCISYLPQGGLPRAARRAKLRSSFGFECGCARCGLKGAERARSDERLKALGALARPHEAELPAARLVEAVDGRLRLLAEEGLPAVWAWRPLLFPLVHASVRDLSARGRLGGSRRRCAAWAARACACVRGAAGSDHPRHELVAALLGMVADDAGALAEQHFMRVVAEAMSEVPA